MPAAPTEAYIVLEESDGQDLNSVPIVLRQCGSLSVDGLSTRQRLVTDFRAKVLEAGASVFYGDHFLGGILAMSQIRIAVIILEGGVV